MGIIAATKAYLGIGAPPIDGDPFYDDVILLVRSVGATDEQSTFLDDSIVGRTLSQVGGVAYGVAQTKFEAASLEYDGVGADYVSIPNAADLDFSDRTVEFCIEAWVYTTDNSHTNTILCGRDASSAEEWDLRITGGTGAAFSVWGSSNFTVNYTSSITQDTWHHIAVTNTIDPSDPTDGILTMYVDGVAGATTTRTSNGSVNTGVYQIGYNLFNSTRGMEGNIDSVRITRGNPRYRHDFNVLTTSFPNDSVVTGYDTQVFSDTPAGYWKMNEASGNLLDSIHSNDIIPADITYEETPINGVAGSTSVSFDGGVGSGGDPLVVDSPELQMIGDVTIEIWLEPTGNFTTNRHFLMCSFDGETEAQNANWSLGMSDTGNPRFFWESSTGTNHSEETTLALPENTWIHLVAVRDDSAKTVDIYVNGEFFEQLTYTTSATGGTETGIFLGHTQGDSGRHIGRMQNAAVYDYTLSAERILAHYNANGHKGWYQTILDAVPVGWWRMNEVVGDISLDETANQNDITWVGSTIEPGLVNDGGKSREILHGTTDGANNSTPSSELLIPGDVTFECWVVLTSYNTENCYFVVFGATGESTDNNWQYGFGHADTGPMRYFHEYDTDGKNEFDESGADIPLNELVHLAFVRDISAHSVKFYINGQQTGSTMTWAAERDPTGGADGELWIGRQINTGSAIDGEIDECVIFDSALTDAQIYDHFNQGYGVQDAVVPFLAIGMEDESILDAAITSSSFHSPSGSESYDGRINNANRWATATSDETTSWIKVDMGEIVQVGKVATQGSPINDQWLLTYEIDYNHDDGTVWTEYNGGEALTGNVDRDSIVSHDLIPFSARYFRIRPKTRSTWMSLRFEVYARPETRQLEWPLGMESGIILDAALSASSNFSGQDADKGRLNDASAWATASADEPTSWMKIDMGSVKIVGGVASQGSPLASEWLTGYEIDYNDDDGGSWTEYNSGEVLTGNTDQSTIVTHELIPFSARYVRLRPKTYSGWMSSRWELYVT
jgi:hypothetical protein